MNIRFYLREHSRSGQTYIWADIRANGLRLRTSANIQVLPSEWNEKRQEIRGTDKATSSLNARLKDIEGAAHDIYQAHLSSGTMLTMDILKHEVTRIIYPEKALKHHSVKKGGYTNLIDVAAYFVDENPKNLKANTIREYKTMKTILADYADTYGRSSLEFGSLTLGFYERFVKFLYAKNYMVNTTDTKVKWVKSLMNYASERGWNHNRDYEKFRRKGEETAAIALTEEEVDKLYALKIPAELETVRDEFVFSCYTGLRFSDLMNLRKENWKGDYISVKTIKTDDFLDIPLRTQARDILEKYKGEFPQSSNHSYNDKIKTVCSKLPSLNVYERIYSSAGNKRKEEKIKKHELVTSHTGRRTFATNCVIRGIPIPLIMNVTGHKTLSSFQKYIRIAQKSNAALLLKEFKKIDKDAA